MFYESSCRERDVIPEEKLPGQEPLQVLEQMIVTGSKIRTIGRLLKHLSEELLQRLFVQRPIMADVVLGRHTDSTKHPTLPLLNGPSQVR
ncbi:hypothetical protein AVEN_63645-1 [Araneus ventricosus]|uniref:Uncharacterized protein n=1 Tax=Araneus ventricosus TaxID=182803 RepID=A0A4Y2X5V4_ARAVE|nr:hypothetical protein AVEN_27134-1 [Araneus ventricosus]GBO46114.1 hypothetical protein AVEN_63645-1 [Araneus ventricosus]